MTRRTVVDRVLHLALPGFPGGEPTWGLGTLSRRTTYVLSSATAGDTRGASGDDGVGAVRVSGSRARRLTKSPPDTRTGRVRVPSRTRGGLSASLPTSYPLPPARPARDTGSVPE